MTKPTARTTGTPDEAILLSNFKLLTPGEQAHIQRLVLRLVIVRADPPKPATHIVMGYSRGEPCIVMGSSTPSASAAKESGND